MRTHLFRAYEWLKLAMPAIFFLAGFAWDALTLGQRAGPQDFGILSVYLLLAGGLLWWMAHDRFHPIPLCDMPMNRREWRDHGMAWVRYHGPSLGLQFLFGSLLSALFIFYVKSAGHLGTLILSAILGGLLVGNEFLGRYYRHRFTLNWGLFGLCTILLLNFLLPHLLHSLHPAWFYLSTIAGAGLTHALHYFSTGQPGKIKTVWVLAGLLAVANLGDLIPPVPLVEKRVLLGADFSKDTGEYVARVEKAPWWVFWRRYSKTLHLAPGERVYCLSAVFAPSGLNTQLQHRWERRDQNGKWQFVHEVRFGLSGGRENGFRGYSYKEAPTAGEWRVLIRSETGRTLAVHRFTIQLDPPDPDLVAWEKL